MADTDTSAIIDISQQLDVLIVRYFQTLADVFNHKQQLENDMKDGFFYMAKARYSMGSARVGRLQYNDAELDRALVHVDIDTSSDSSCAYSFLPNIDIPQPKPTKLHAEENISSVNDTEPMDLTTDIQFGLRKRKVYPADASPTTDVGDHGDESTLVDDVKKLSVSTEKAKKDGDGSKLSTTQDPLHWFGILIPMALRQSQAAFRRSVDTICKIASLQSQLLDIREQYHTALKAKHHLSVLSAVAEDSSAD